MIARASFEFVYKGLLVLHSFLAVYPIDIESDINPSSEALKKLMLWVRELLEARSSRMNRGLSGGK